MVLGSYLIVITDLESVGNYLGHPIFKVLSLKVLPCDHSLRNSPEEQVKLSYVTVLDFAVSLIGVITVMLVLTNCLTEKY